MARLREKSVRQTAYLLHLAEEWLLPLGFRIGSPQDAGQRGSHISLRHPEAYRIRRAMIELPPMAARKKTPSAMRVIPDFRAPDNIRLGIAPLYTTFRDIYRALDYMRWIVDEQIYQGYSDERQAVT